MMSVDDRITAIVNGLVELIAGYWASAGWMMGNVGCFLEML